MDSMSPDFLAQCIALYKEREREKEKEKAVPTWGELSSLALSDSITDKLGSPHSTTASFHLPVSYLEAKYYYYRLYSKPVLMARTGYWTWIFASIYSDPICLTTFRDSDSKRNLQGTDTWEPPTDPEAYLPCKELRPISSNHPLNAVWDNLAPRILNILDSKGVKWTSMDIVRISFTGEYVAPIVVWIGIKPGTLSGEDGLAAVKECKQVLMANEILDVEVEIHESVRWP
ncbi:hypothetical protein SCP_1403150 [Sparassis crispa]|uniref:Uncharacterized protein n=1 Tax=Sparassis crispa TaxID=139825 RepID=A0A401H399_9APHY|nr:hypothetical protein SCP_1403150 [Sparassis crispa]GBE88907.1 hypothetical protein SCP_1403150 [Sparassis crispa]